MTENSVTNNTGKRNLWIIASLIAFLLNFVPSLVPGQSVLRDSAHGTTPFTIQHFFFVAWWAFLYLLQVTYLIQLYSKNQDVQKVALAAAPCFVVYSVLEAIWSALWVRHYWAIAEVIVAANLFQVTLAYLRLKSYASSLGVYLTIHTPTVALPFAYLFHLLLWNGAAAVHAHHFIGRVFANVFIWTLLLVPLTFLFLFRDWSLGLGFSYLTAGLAVGQFWTKVIALQWIFAFVIMGIVFVFTVVVAIPRLLTGQGQRAPADLDTERAPLLTE